MKKYLRVTMPDGSKWDVPAQIIASNRARYYAKLDSGEESGEPYNTIYALELSADDDELIDWAANNMNWNDVEGCATRIETPSIAPDYQEGWVNGGQVPTGPLVPITVGIASRNVAERRTP